MSNLSLEQVLINHQEKLLNQELLQQALGAAFDGLFKHTIKFSLLFMGITFALHTIDHVNDYVKYKLKK